MGEFVAWIIGWDLVLEYAVGAATVAIAWSEYFNRILEILGSTSPTNGAIHRSSPRDGVHGIMNIPAVVILIVLSLLLIRGTPRVGVRQRHHRDHQGHDRAGGHRRRLGVHQPGQPHAAHSRPRRPTSRPQGVTHNYGGILGILGAAGVVFFAFIGFDAVSTAAQETKNPKKDMPFGILGSLVVCTVLYVLFSYVLSGVATVQDFRTAGREASVAYAITHLHDRLRVAGDVR